MEAKLRRYEHTLEIVGKGVVALGGWLVFKFFIFIFFEKEALYGMLEAEGLEVNKYVEILIIVSTVFVMVVAFLIQLFVGLSAISEGKKKKNRFAYIVVAVLLVGIYIFDIVIQIEKYWGENPDILNNTTSVIIDVTQLYILIDMIISAIKIKIIRKEISMPVM